jgi:hypothetical protein
VNHARRYVPLAVFILVPSALIVPALWDGDMLYGHDVVNVFYHQRVVIGQAFREGRLPVWDPHVMAGFPLLAGVQGAVFYPPTWLCVVLSAGAFWTFSVLLHLILAGVFAHRWLERGLGLGPWAALAGAVVYMLSGYIAGHLYAGHVNYVWAYPWMAALLWRLERYLAAPTLKRGVLLAVVFAMLFLAGVPQYAYFAGLLILTRGLHFVLAEREGRRARAAILGKGAAWLALGLLVCAPQLFPTLELLTQMQRGRDEDRSFITEHYLPPHRLLDIIWPPKRSMLDPFWERCGFVGAGAVMLAFAALVEKHRQRFVWLGFGLIGLLLAMGLDTPVYPGIMQILPGAGLFRGPGRYLFFFTLGMAALAAIGFHGLWNRGLPLTRIGAVVLALTSAVPLVRFAWGVIDPVVPGDYTKFDLVDLVRKKIGDDGRIATTMVEDIGKCQAAGVDTVCGYEPMMLRRYAELMNVAQGYPAEKNIVIQASVGRHPVIDMLGVQGWLTREGGRYQSLHSYQNRKHIVQENSNALPRAWLVNNAVVIESREERLKVLGKGPWDPRKTVILEEYPAGAPPVPTEGSAGTARIRSRKAGEYVLEAENDADAFLVLSEAYYPGWSAEVDGKPAEVLPANHLIQAVRLPAGKHVVRFAYRSRFLGAGAAIAFLAALVPVAIELVRRRRR